jgi:hypothetical protein
MIYSSKKIETASRLIEQRIPREMAYRMMGLVERNTSSVVMINAANTILLGHEKTLSNCKKHLPKNAVSDEG